MLRFISALWNGSIAPCDCCGAYDEKANHLIGLLERNRIALNEELTAAQEELFEKYIACSDEYLLRMMELSFCDGFTLGTNLTVEALG